MNILYGDTIKIITQGSGSHSIICGSATDKELYKNIPKCDLCFTSPPYNVSKSVNEKINGSNDKYKLGGSDDLPEEEYLSLIIQASKNSIDKTSLSLINYQMLSANKRILINYQYQLQNFLSDIIIWDKGSAAPAMGKKVLNSRFEFIYVFSKRATRTLGVKDFRGEVDNVWAIGGQRRNNYHKFHSATFPIALSNKAISHFAIKNVLDVFMGTGTTMISAVSNKIDSYNIELAHEYCLLALSRAVRYLRYKKISYLVVHNNETVKEKSLDRLIDRFK